VGVPSQVEKNPLVRPGFTNGTSTQVSHRVPPFIVCEYRIAEKSCHCSRAIREHKEARNAPDFGAFFRLMWAKVLKYAHHPIAMLAGLWEKEREDWLKAGSDPRPPVFILVCKNTRIAKVVYDWLANNESPAGSPPARIEGFRNKNGQINTIRVDSKVVHETDTGEAKSDEARWMRVTGRGVAIREFPMKSGFEETDYLLYVDGQAVGVIEAKKEGSTLAGFEIQTAKYSEGLPDSLPAPKRPLPFGYSEPARHGFDAGTARPHSPRLRR